MNRLLILLVLGLSSINIASAQSLELVEGAAELSLSDISFPNSTAGTATFTECPTCETKRLSVDSQTVYLGLSGSVSLQDFLIDVAELRMTIEGQDTFVGLFYNLTTNRVTRISLHPDAH